jgi:hypothetical protein
MMKKIFLLLPFCTIALSACTRAKYPQAPVVHEFKTQELMTSQDTLNSSYSNISITNGTGASITSSGVFIASYDINDCSACFGSVMAGDNVAGAMIEPVAFGAGQTIQIGQNYLYNLIYNGITVVRNTVGTPPCLLPGCSWNGDTPIAGWCISLNVMSRQSSYTHSNYSNGLNTPANVVPFSGAGNSAPFDYKFDLIDPATLATGGSCLGLVVCDDTTLTCRVSSSQDQRFQAY